MSKSKIWGSCALLSAYIALFGYLAMYSSPSGDDFMSLYALDKGFWTSQIDYWFGWGGRFTSAFILSSGYVLNVMEHYGWHSVLAICFSIFSLFIFIHVLFPDAKNLSKIFFTLLLQAAWLSTAVDLGQSLYWFNGFTYYLTSGFFLLEFALIVKIYRGEFSRGIFFALCALILLNSGVSEISAAYQMPMCIMAALACHIAGRKKAASYIWLVFLVAAAGFLLQVFNPGNAKRIPELYGLGPNPMPVAKDLLMTYKVAVISGLISFKDFLFGHWIIYSVFLFMPSMNRNVRVPEFVEKMPFRCKLWYVFLFELATMCCFQAIGGYSMGNFLYSRAMAPVFWVMFAQWVVFFVFIYRNEALSKRIEGMKIYKFRAAVFALLLLLSANSRALVRDYMLAPEYMSELKERRAYMAEQRALGNREIIMPGIKKGFRLATSDGAPDPRRFPWYSRYYGFDSVRDVYAPLVESARQGELDEMKKLIELSNDGDMDAQVLLAMYLDGSNFDRVSPVLGKNDEAAWLLYYKAAAQGDKGSQNHLWTFYLGGIRSQHDSEIIKWGILSMINPF